MVSQYHFFNFIWVLANERSKETTRLWQGYRISPRFLLRHWCPSILTSILKGEWKFPAVQPSSGYLLSFSHLLWLNSTLTVGWAKHRKTASDLTQSFLNAKVCQDLWSVLLINTKGRHYVLIFWESFLSLLVPCILLLALQLNCQDYQFPLIFTGDADRLFKFESQGFQNLKQALTDLSFNMDWIHGQYDILVRIFHS